jgi:phosphotransferase system HPr-like phosphotransfer protein
MMTAEIELGPGEKITPSVAVAIALKCRQCKSKVCLSCGDFLNIDGRSFKHVHRLGNMPDPLVKIIVSGKDELPVMCELRDLVKYGK